MKQKSGQTEQGGRTDRMADICQLAEALYQLTGLPFSVWWPGGRPVFACGPQAGIETAAVSGFCADHHVFAGRMAFDLGEPYVYEGRHDSTFVACAIVQQEAYRAFVLAGPFILGEITARSIGRILAAEPADLLNQYHQLQQMKQLDAEQVSALTAVVQQQFAAPQTEEGSRLSARSLGRKLSEDYLTLNATREHSTDSEEEQAPRPVTERAALVERLQRQQIEAAVRLCETRIRDAILVMGHDLETVKNDTAGLLAFLTKYYLNFGQMTEADFAAVADFQIRISEARSIADLMAPLSEAMVHLSTVCRISDIDNRSPIVFEAAEYVNRNFQNRISLDSVARLLHVNKSYLSKRFKMEMGVTFTEYVNQLKINYARRMLAQSPVLVADLAVQLGFQNHSYFSKIFQQYTGTTPNLYRRQARGARMEARSREEKSHVDLSD